jgi:hypothetical protein
MAIPFMTATLSRADIEDLEAYVSDNAATIRRRMPRELGSLCGFLAATTYIYIYTCSKTEAASNYTKEHIAPKLCFISNFR